MNQTIDTKAAPTAEPRLQDAAPRLGDDQRVDRRQQKPPNAPTAAASVGVASPNTIEPSTARISNASGKNDANSILKICKRSNVPAARRRPRVTMHADAEHDPEAVGAGRGPGRGGRACAADRVRRGGRGSAACAAGGRRLGVALLRSLSPRPAPAGLFRSRWFREPAASLGGSAAPAVRVGSPAGSRAAARPICLQSAR